MTDEEYMDYAKASKYTAIPLGTLYYLVSRHLIPHSRPPYPNAKIVRFKKSELDAWLTQPKAHQNKAAKNRIII